MSSLTPRFSTQVSPSCSASSNSNPYCMPEHPPPCMKTRSLRFGLPSPRIRSPTLRAAASVNVNVSRVSVMTCTLRAVLGRRNRVGRLGLALGFQGRGAIGERDELARNDGSGRHFNHAVMNVAVDPGLFAEDQPIARAHVAVDRAIHDDVRDFDVSFDEAAFAHRQRAPVFRGATDVAEHPTVEMQATRELEVALEIC